MRLKTTLPPVLVEEDRERVKSFISRVEWKMGKLVFFDKDFANERKPLVIQIGAVGNAFGKPHTSGVMEVLHSQKFLETEFEKDGIAVIWSFLVGTGPAINEGLANGSVDFGCYGDLCGVLGKASGIESVALASGGRGTNVYIAVKADDDRNKSFWDLKGKRIGFRKGTPFHLQFEKLLFRHGLVEKDFDIFNVGIAEGTAALLSGKIDAYVGTAYFLSLQAEGFVRIIYDSRQENPSFKGNGVLVGRGEFVRHYPGIVQRVIKAYVKAAYWASDERNRVNFFEINTLKGMSYPAVETDHQGDALKGRKNPLLDDFFFRYFSSAVAFARQRGLIEKVFDVADWADKSFVEAALKDLGLENYWRDEKSRKVHGEFLGRQKKVSAS